MVARSEELVCGSSFLGNVGSNPAGNMDVLLLSVMSVVRQRSLRCANHFSRGLVPGVVYLSVIVKPQ